MHLAGEQKRLPKLTLFVHLENGVVVDATLSPETRKCLETLAMKQGSVTVTALPGNGKAIRAKNLPAQDNASRISSAALSYSIVIAALSNLSQVQL